MNPISSWNAFAKPRTFPSLRPWIQWLRIQSFLSHFYIKPQPAALILTECRIASYLISTSNHNPVARAVASRSIASYLISTSNHNLDGSINWRGTLLLISFLHQTTTQLHILTDDLNCFLSHFYIKPQPSRRTPRRTAIASYLISTSNHNLSWRVIATAKLLLISFLHQTTTSGCRSRHPENCFLSHFYIKPQHICTIYICTRIASYLISTSNHNGYTDRPPHMMIASYLISTSNHNNQRERLALQWLLLISFLHQTTTVRLLVTCRLHCFLSHFYIKPQRILYNHLIYNELWHVEHIRSGWIFLLRQQKY